MENEPAHEGGNDSRNEGAGETAGARANAVTDDALPAGTVPPAPTGSAAPAPLSPSASLSSSPNGGAPTGPPRRPTWRFMFSHPAYPIGLGFGSGLSPFAPGTVGTLWAWLFFLLFRPDLSDAQWGGVMLAAAALGWWACTATARGLRSADPGAIVWDEVLAFWLVLWLVTPAGLGAQLAAFLLFRYFDAAKPGPVGWADRCFKGVPGAPIGWTQGFGILFDDLVAAGCTLFVIAGWRWCFH